MPLDISPEEFRRLAERVAQIASEYLASLDRLPIAPRASGAETERLFGLDPPESGMGEGVLALLRRVVDHSRAQNGRFVGYVLGSGEPVAATADLLASVLNQNVTAWRSAPSAVAIERALVAWLGRAIGCPGFTGSLTGGGSSANLMGLAMARESRAPANESGATPAAVYASQEVHMSIPKAVALLGIGRNHLRMLPVDDAFRIRVDALERAVEEDERAGRRPLAVVASAGTISTGSIDPLEEIAEVARRHRIWLHVDGAYGGIAAMVAPEKFAGLSRADSVSIDGHKWLYQPVDCGCLLFRDPEQARRAFAHTGEYARSLTEDPIEGFAFFEESAELSRRFRALKLWASLHYHGVSAYREAMRRDLAHGQLLASKVRREPRLELLAPVSLSAVCFRVHFPEQADARNGEVLRRVNGRGRVYLSNAVIRGAFALRACFVNHRTTEADVDAIVEEVLACAGAA